LIEVLEDSYYVLHIIGKSAEDKERSCKKSTPGAASEIQQEQG
jgi:hypothetical protein